MIDGAPLTLNLTDAAAGKLKELTAGETNPAVGLRVYVYSGGSREKRGRSSAWRVVR